MADYEQAAREKDELREREKTGRKRFRVECVNIYGGTWVECYVTEESLKGTLKLIDYNEISRVEITRL